MTPIQFARIASLSGACLLSCAALADLPVPAVAPVLDLWAIDISGDSLLGELELDRLMQPFLGPGRSLDDVDRARDTLESRYRQLGYKTVSVAIPRQTAKDGIVRLEVVEGRVERLNVVGSRYHSIDQIKLEAPSLAVGQVPNFDRVQQDIVALNRSESRKVTPALRPGSTPGAIQVDLAVQDELPVQASLEVNNRRSANTTALRALGTVGFNNLWQLGHSLTASYQTAPERMSDAQVLFLSYRAPFGRSRYSLLVNGIQSNSDVSTVGGASVIGRGEILGLRLNIELPGSDSFFPSASVGFDYKHFRSAIALNGSALNTPITYVPLLFGYSFVAPSSGGVTQANASLSLAIPQIGSTRADFDDSRFRARGQQLTLKQSVSRTQNLPYRFVADVRLSSQITDQPLISNEQFSVGGADSVRGYLESEALADSGFSGSFELRHGLIDDDVEVAPGFVPLSNVRVYGYVDGAHLRLRDALPDQQTRYDLLSTGAGLSLRLLATLDASIDYAVPLLDGPFQRKGDGRVLFRVSGSY